MARDAMVASGADGALAHHANLASTVCPVIDPAKFHLIIQVAKHLSALSDASRVRAVPCH
jgi:hypothetical protein